MAEENYYPVQVLRAHATELEAMVSVCLAEPEEKPVHRLRTESRRLEAQVLLLGQLPELPEHRKQGRRLLRELKRLRKAAGRVRDLDVQEHTLEGIAEAAAQNVGKAVPDDAHERKSAAAKSKPAKGVAGQAAAAEIVAEVPATGESLLREGAESLRDSLRKKRNSAAGTLQTLLRKRQTKTAKATEGLLEQLKEAEERTLPPAELLRHVQAVFAREGLLVAGENNAEPVKHLDTEQLHALRKSAKAARYVAETLPGAAPVMAAAAHFHALQNAGGEWHDALDLERAARRHLGRRHELTVAIAAERKMKLEAYSAMLKAEVAGAKRSRRAPEPAKQAKRPVRSVRRPAKSARTAAAAA